MGRPLHKKYFGNRNPDGVAGEGIASVAVANSGTAYVGTESAVVEPPELPGGQTAVVDLLFNNGNVTGAVIVEAGSGYTDAPTITVSPASTGTTATFTVSLTSTRENGITAHAWVEGDSGSDLADAVKQASSRRYRVTTAAGSGVCSLVGYNPTKAGEMNIFAYDSDGGTYYVTKLTARRATIVRDTGTQFDSNTTVGWNLTAAVPGVSVVLEHE